MKRTSLAGLLLAIGMAQGAPAGDLQSAADPTAMAYVKLAFDSGARETAPPAFGIRLASTNAAAWSQHSPDSKWRTPAVDLRLTDYNTIRLNDVPVFNLTGGGSFGKFVWQDWTPAIIAVGIATVFVLNTQLVKDRDTPPSGSGNGGALD